MCLGHQTALSCDIYLVAGIYRATCKHSDVASEEGREGSFAQGRILAPRGITSRA